MRVPITGRVPKESGKPHKPDHDGCCQRVQCLLWVNETPPILQRGRTDVQQIR